MKAGFGLIKPAVMDQVIVLNVNDKGYPAMVYHWTVAAIDGLLMDAAHGQTTTYEARGSCFL
jgi:6-phosphogluconate dehydrogenase